MKIIQDEIFFEYLSNPSRSVVGEKSQIKAKTPSFIASNAKGDLQTLPDLHDFEMLGKKSADRLQVLFK